MTDKPWLQQYPADVPAEIDMNEFSSVVDVINKKLHGVSGSDCLCEFRGGAELPQVDDYSRAFGARMQALGLERGEFELAIMMPKRAAVSDCRVWRVAGRAGGRQ